MDEDTVYQNSVDKDNGHVSYPKTTAIDGLVQQQPAGCSSSLLPSEDDGSKSQKTKSFLRTITGKQRIILATLAWLNLTNFCALSVLGPFFPPEAESKGMSQSVSGFVFSWFAMVYTIMCPVWGKLIPYIGIRFAIATGVFVSGTCNILFGFLNRVESLESFTMLCFVVRSTEAMGASAFMTGSFTLVTQVFSKNIGSTMGTLETFIGVGLSIGPPIGGLLYELGGYTLPFISVGLCMIFSVPIYLYILPQEEFVEKKNGSSILAILKNGRVVMILMVVVALNGQWCFQDPTLERHLSQFNLTATEVGLFFLLEASVYAISSPIWGVVSDRTSNKWILMIIGLFGSTFSFLLLGPSPLLPFLPNTMWLNGIAAVMISVFNVMGLIPTYQAIIDCATDESSGSEVDLGTFSVVAGLWSSMNSLGEILGDSTGGLLVDNFGFQTASTVIGLASTVVATLLLTYFCTRGSPCNTRSSPGNLRPCNETTNLLMHSSNGRASDLPLWRSKVEV